MLNQRSKKILTVISLSLLIFSGIGYSIYYLYVENQKKQISIDITICTIGDSLTDGGNYGKTMEFGEKWNFGYQIDIYRYLKTRNVESSILNLGIGGQLINQICSRFNETVPADYIVSMGGTNNLWWWANYSDPLIEQNLTQEVIFHYNLTIFNTIEYQVEQGYNSPIIIICSIPPIGNVSNLPQKMAATIDYVNTQLKQWVLGLNRPDILFCDVNRNMKNMDGYMIDGLYSDGVHFTANGNAVCGETIAQIITDHYYSRL